MWNDRMVMYLFSIRFYRLQSLQVLKETIRIQRSISTQERNSDE